MYVESDFNKVYTWIRGWEPTKLKYKVKMDHQAVPHSYIKWCDSNCRGKWSWYFDLHHGYISFENAIDVTLFKLKRFNVF